MTNITKTPPTAATGTNMWVNLVLLIASLFGGMSGTDAGIIGAAIAAVIGAVFAIRNWIVTAKFKLDKSWIADPNNWAYLAAVVTGLIPAAAPLIPGLKSLAEALVSGNWPAIITGAVSLISLVWYTFFKNKAPRGAATLLILIASCTMYSAQANNSYYIHDDEGFTPWTEVLE